MSVTSIAPVWFEGRRALALFTLTCFSTPAIAASGVERFSWGDPNLQGVWDYRTATPLETPTTLGRRTEFSAEEALEFEQHSQKRGRSFVESLGDYVGDEPWADRGTSLTEADRGSLIIDPRSGKLPFRTPYGESLKGRFVAQMTGSPQGPEDRTVLERCIIAPLVPLSSLNFNNNISIVQTPDHVVVVNEMVHDARIIPLNATSNPQLTAARRWLGQSWGHWEDDTLVVVTTNFRDYPNLLGTSPNVEIVERFSLDVTNTQEKLVYEYTITDPDVFEQPWSARQTLSRTNGRMYEYACHEGNQSMTLMLRGARLEEQRAAADAP